MSDHTAALLEAIRGYHTATAGQREHQRRNEYLARVREELERTQATPQSPGRAAALTASHATPEKPTVGESFDQASEKALAAFKGS